MAPAIPIVGGVAALGLITLRLRAMAKAKAAALIPVQQGTDPRTGQPIFGLPGAKPITATAPNGQTATFTSLRQEPPQPLTTGQRKPTTEELAKLLSFGIPPDPSDAAATAAFNSGAASAAQNAFANSLPDVNWNSPTDADVQAALALIASHLGSTQVATPP